MKRENSMKYKIALLLTGLSLLSTPEAFPQEVIEIPPLFEYPSAPESLETMTDRSNYLVDHFWEPLDLKSKKAVDQNALNEALRIYSVPLRWADKARATAATDKLIEKLSKNPTLLLQFTKAAEETLYGPRADVWIDEIYLKFLNAIVKNKKIPENRRAKYEKQLKKISGCALGTTPPEFKFTGRNGKSETYYPMTTVSIMIFGNPADTDWRMARLRMETNTRLKQAVDQGKISIHYIIPFEKKDWESDVASYPANWVVGMAPDLADLYDLRMSPSIYLIGSDGKIISKNIALDTAINQALESIK